MRFVFGRASFLTLALAVLSVTLPACNGQQAALGHLPPATPTPAPGSTATPGPVGSATPIPPPPAANALGMNVGAVTDTETNRAFADAMKTSRIPWTTIDFTANAVADPNGWPLQDAAIRVWSGRPRMDGVYALSFSGQAIVQTSLGTLSPVTYSPSSNTTSATLTISDSSPQDLTLTFTSTRLLPSSAANTGVSAVKLMRPLSEGSGSNYPTSTTFTTDFKSSLAPFSTLRFADWLASNGNPQQHWTDRVTPTSASQTVLAGSTSQLKGAAYEYAFQLCSETNEDCWINIPAGADDDYVQHVAQLAQTALPSNLHLYVEYSNEVWNQNYAQSAINHQAAQANASVLAFDGTTNSNYIDWRRIAQRGAQISAIFRSTFGDAAMMTRVRPVLMTQLGNADGPLQQAVYFMEGYYNNPAQAGISTPHPLNYYFYGLGGGADYAPGDESSTGAILATLSAAVGASPQLGWAASLPKDAAYAAAFGVHRIAYEGGPYFAPTNSATTNGYLQAAHDSPLIAPEIVAAHNTWSANGGDLLVYYTVTGNYTWGFLDDVFDLGSQPYNYKMQAMTQLAAGTRPAITIGTLLPASIPAASFDVPASTLQSQQVSGFTQGTWFGYLTRVDAAGTFTVGLHAGSADGKGVAEIWVDGNELGTLSATTTLGTNGATSATGTLPVTLNAGLHGILVRGAPATSKLAVTSVDVARTSTSSGSRRR